jgi:RNA polymerase sigma factor (sigma-70 family)
MHADDMELVQEFAAGNSEEAFATLVRRHINLVYSVALRRLNNVHEAEEVTQAVFIILAKKAAGLRAGTILSGWLYQTAQLTAANFQRAAWRRQRREQEAYMRFAQESETDPSWQRLSPLLEEAMLRLGADERNAVVLRFFENRPVRDVAAALGLQDAAAQKRINRATDKLRKFFLRRGIQISAGALIAALGANSVQAAPETLAAAVTASAAAKGVSAAGSTLTLIKTTLKLMAWTKAKTAIVVGAAILLAGGATSIVVRHVNRIRQETHVPQIVNFIPPKGAQRVSPDLTEVRITFDVPMGEGFSWTGASNDPQIPPFPDGMGSEDIHWTADHKTIVRPVRLKPGANYRLGLNSPSHKNFQSASGVPLVPIVLNFRTGDK